MEVSFSISFWLTCRLNIHISFPISVDYIHTGQMPSPRKKSRLLETSQIHAHEKTVPTPCNVRPLFTRKIYTCIYCLFIRFLFTERIVIVLSVVISKLTWRHTRCILHYLPLWRNEWIHGNVFIIVCRIFHTCEFYSIDDALKGSLNLSNFLCFTLTGLLKPLETFCFPKLLNKSKLPKSVEIIQNILLNGEE